MASSGNFCTLNPIAQLGTSTDDRSGSMSNGNLKYVNLTGNTAVGTFGVTSGKWYFEVYINSFNADNGMTIGWVNDMFNLNAELGYNSPSSPSDAQGFGWYAETNNLIYGPGNGTSTYNKSWGGGTKVTDGDIVGFYLDADDGKFWASKNGTVFNSGDPSAGTGHGFGTGGSPHNIAISSRTLYPAIGNWSGADATVTFNFGQDSTFQGAVSAGGNADGNGFGDFKYDPDGFSALCSANLPTSANIDPAETDDNIPTKNFGVVTLTGNGSARTISGLGFQPDFIFAKKRSNGKRGYSVDSSRGFTKYLHPDGNFSEGTSSDGITAATSDGFDIGGSLDYINENTHTYVAWCWRANGGTTASNTSGTITTTVQANQAAGFSILTYTGNDGSWGSGNRDTIGHGLSAAPEFMIFKERNATDASTVFHHSVGAGGGTTAAHNNLRIDNSDALYTNQSYKSFGGVMPTSTVITIEGNTTNLNTSTHVAYCWHGVDGYSNFGSYEGNGATDGTFVYTGFRPRMVFVKQIDGAAEWACYDTARDIDNEMGNCLEWDLEAAEKTHASDLSTDAMMVFSNGFKLTGGGGGRTNQSGRTYVFGAWADVPFKYNNTF